MARVRLDSSNRICSERYHECFRIVDTHQFVLTETHVGVDVAHNHRSAKKDNEQENARLDELRRIEMLSVTKKGKEGTICPFVTVSPHDIG